MMVIPNIIDPSVPIGKNDEENVEIEKFGEPIHFCKTHYSCNYITTNHK